MSRLVLMLMLASFAFYGLSGCANKNSANPDNAALQFSAKGRVVAKVNNIPIGLDDLNQEIDVYNSMIPAESPELKITTLEKKIDYLKNEMVRRALLYQVALDRKLDKDKDYIDALEKAKLDLLVMALVKQELGKVEVTSKEIEDYYEANKDNFRGPQEFEIREIVVPTENEGKDIHKELFEGGDFVSLAKSRSKSKSSSSGGSLGFVSEEALSKEMSNIVSALPVGMPSGVFKGADGYYIIKVESRRPGEQMTLDQVREDIRRGLTFLKQQQRIEELTTKAARKSKIEVYEKEVK